MSEPIHGMARRNLDSEFENDEAHKSNLLLEARLLAARGRDVAENFALAAQIEEDLAPLIRAAFDGEVVRSPIQCGK